MSVQPRYKRLRRSVSDDVIVLASDDDTYDPLPEPPPRRVAPMRLVREPRGAVRAEVAPGVDNFDAVRAAAVDMVAPGMPRRWLRPAYASAAPRRALAPAPGEDPDYCESATPSTDDDARDTGAAGRLALFASQQYSSSDDEPDTAVTRFLAELRTYRGMDQRERFAAALYYAVRCARDPQYPARLDDAVSGALTAERLVVRGGAVAQVWQAPGVRADLLMRSAVWRPELVQRLDRCPVLLAEPLHRAAERVVCEVCRRETHWASTALTLAGPRAGVADRVSGAHLYEQCRRFERWSASAREHGNYDAEDDTVVAELPDTAAYLVGEDCTRRIAIYHSLRHLWLDLAQLCVTRLAPLGLPPKAAAARLRDGLEPGLVDECWRAYCGALDAADMYRESWHALSFAEREPGISVESDDDDASSQ